MESVTIRDSQSQASATILPGLGFNCYDFRVPCHGTPLPILWADPQFSSGTCRASGSGIPLLFPFAGRIPGTRLQWRGKEYPLEAGDGRGNAIHGFVMDRAWRVTAVEDQRVTGEFQASVDDPDLQRRWPSDFRIAVTYEVQGATLACAIEIHNPGEVPLPYLLGTHAYFRVELAGVPDHCLVELPVTSQWELQDLLATGRQLPIPTGYDSPLPFANLQLDNVFTGLRFDGDLCQTRLANPASGVSVVQEFDRTFRECVVYTPPHREAICMEPYSGVPNAFHLEQQGIDAGLKILQPGESLSTHVAIRVSHRQ